jgi:hypothetical protein
LPARADPPRLAEYVALARGDTPPKGLGDIERLSASLIVSDDEREPEAPARVSKSGSRAKRRGRAGRRAARK